MQNPVCHTCDSGTYQDEVGGNFCKTCKMGRYTSTAEECYLRCEAGSRTNRNTRADGCEKCPKGSYSETHGEYNCIECEAGHFAASEGSTACSPCPANKFMSLTGQDRCVDCNEDCKAESAATVCVGKDFCGKEYLDASGIQRYILLL